ncbi:hypothetical protein [Amycolatopsis tucumanensis]
MKVDAPERLVHLVARRSYAVYEAELRGLADIHDERGSIRDAL